MCLCLCNVVTTFYIDTVQNEEHKVIVLLFVVMLFIILFVFVTSLMFCFFIGMGELLMKHG